MSEQKSTPTSVISPEIDIPKWEIIDLLPEVYKTYDADQIADLMFEQLVQRGINPNTVIYSGFDGTNVIKNGTFGDRTSTYAANKTEMLQANVRGRDSGTHSPIHYIENEDPDVPVIAVFDPSKLLGSAQKTVRKYMDEVKEEDLTSLRSYLYWATKDRSSLDSATLLIFKFNK